MLSARTPSGYFPGHRIANLQARPARALLQGETHMLAMNGKRSLVVCDAENLSYSLHNRGLDVDYAQLSARVLAQCGTGSELHAFATLEEGPQSLCAERYFEDSGWTAHVQPIERVKGVDGVRKRANSDNLMLLVAGLRLGALKPEVVLVLSGDGDLVLDIARFTKVVLPQCEVLTLSVPGATSRRLQQGQTSLIAHSAFLGRDVLVASPRRRLH